MRQELTIHAHYNSYIRVRRDKYIYTQFTMVIMRADTYGCGEIWNIDDWIPEKRDRKYLRNKHPEGVSGGITAPMRFRIMRVSRIALMYRDSDFSSRKLNVKSLHRLVNIYKYHSASEIYINVPIFTIIYHLVSNAHYTACWNKYVLKFLIKNHEPPHSCNILLCMTWNIGANIPLQNFAYIFDFINRYMYKIILYKFQRVQ